MYIHLYTIIDWLCENRFLITKLHGKILFRAKHINIVVYPVCGQRENTQLHIYTIVHFFARMDFLEQHHIEAEA
jgi:hypothetical protein